jgi:hypothetical protein
MPQVGQQGCPSSAASKPEATSSPTPGRFWSVARPVLWAETAAPARRRPRAAALRERPAFVN